MTIRSGLYLYLCVSLLLIATIIISSYLLTSNYAAISKIEQSSRALYSFIYSVNSGIMKTKTAVKDFIITGDSRYSSSYDSLIADIDKELQTLTELVEAKSDPTFPIYVKQDFFRYRSNVLSLNKKNLIYLHSASVANRNDYKVRNYLFQQYIDNIQPDFNEFLDRNSISILKMFSSHFQQEKMLHIDSINRLLLHLAVSSAILFILLISFLWYIRQAVISPIKYLMQSTDKVSDGHFELAPTPKFWRNEIRNYIEQFRALINNLKQIDEDNQFAKWIRDGENVLYDQLINAGDINKFYTLVTAELCKRIGANSSILYVYDRQTEKLMLKETYAAPANRQIKKEFMLNESLIGEYALKSEITIITDIPKDYYNINSSLGYINAAEIAFIPLSFDTTLYGILEIASIKKISEFDKEYFRRASRIIASGLHIFLFRN